MWAAFNGHTPVIKYLLEQGAEEGFTALMMAAAEGQMDVVRVLVARGAKMDITDKDGDTAESFARQTGHSDVAGWLARQPHADASLD